MYHDNLDEPDRYGESIKINLLSLKIIWSGHTKSNKNPIP